MYNRLYQNCFFSVLDKLRGRQTIKRLKFLRKSQYWNQNQLKEWRLKNLNILLTTAKHNSTFYSNKFKNINLPLKRLEDLMSLPIMTKQDMRDHFDEIRNPNIPLREMELSKTGGSTGEPAYYYLQNNAKDWNRGTVYRSAEWAGVCLGDPTVQMMGSHFDLKKFQKIKWKLIFFLQRYKDLSVAKVDEKIFDQYYHQIIKFKPSSIWGYASGIYLFANFIEKNYPQSNFNFLKALITSSETLQLPWRQKIEKVFGYNKIFDHYGSREVYIASECSMHRGYHIHEEVIILEVVDKYNNPLPNGERGRILVTDLTNHGFPFIRYEIGDVGVLSTRKTCDCGIKLPLLESIEGRIADMVILPDRILTPPNFTLLMSDYEGVETYQIIQETIDNLSVRIVPNNRINQNVKDYISNCLNELTGPDVNVVIEYVKNIEVPLSGKRRYIISKVSANNI